jgi:undecaprenyl-diphosphatase
LPDFLLHLDTWLFYAVNNGWSNPVFDVFFAAITNTAYWRPVYVLGIVVLVWRGGAGGRWCAGALLVVAAVVDPLSSALLKETIHRLRPFEVLGSVHQLVGTGGGSFPSNHALNNAAAANILTAYYPRWKWLWISLAALIGLSRIYCGVHWPTDVLGGFAIGVLVGGGLVMLARYLQRQTARPQP